ncbi:MAG: hypothetical protein KF799_10335 [Bdellovibrionales bacterium]|nr:hypothetical protein [Bdellovibrionales bacterium]
MVKLLCSILCVFPLALSASVVQPDDEPYFRLRRNGTLYIYDAKSREFIESLAAFNQTFHALYESSYGWKLDEEADYVLTSGRQQTANAYATVFPNIKSVWYPSGAGLLEEMAESSWLLTLDAHETAHLYQLNAKSPTGRRFKSVFGNPLFLLPFIPIFPQPNALLPGSLLEGNAVLNESRLNMGGRLHSGEKRALALAQIEAGDIDASRLINDQFKFPFGENNYVQGGYFQAHLAAKYGIEKTNQFFVAQAEHFIVPLILNRTFREHFGTSFYQEVHEYVHGLKSLAAKQRSSQGEIFLHTTFIGPLNHDASRIWWLATQGKEPVRLYVLDKGARRIDSLLLDLPMGKVFFNGNQPQVAASLQHDLYRKEYSLYGAGASFDPRYSSQIVNDQRAGRTVSLDARESWLEGRLLVNGEPYDVSHSNPLLDESGRVYYFRQNGAERILYRDRQPLVRYDGFYGKLSEIAADGSVYFVGNSDYGSTLYQFNGSEIVRVVDSDRVVDARRLSDDEFVLVEIGAAGRRVVSAPRHVRMERPAVYSYAFAQQNIIPAKALASEQTGNDEKPYHALAETRFNEWGLQTWYTPNSGFRVFSALAFSDPLEFQSFSLGFSSSQFRKRNAFVQYTFSKYLPDFYARYIYTDDWYRRFDTAERRTHGQEAQLGMDLPLWRWRRWQADMGLALIYRSEQPTQETIATALPSHDRKENGGTQTRLRLHYEVPTALGFFPWRELELSAANVFMASTREWRKAENTSMIGALYRHGLKNEYYVTTTLQGAWSEAEDIRIAYETPSLTSDIRLPRLSDKDILHARSAGLARLELHKVLTTPRYSSRIPVGINRFAPFAIAQAMAMDSDPLGERRADLFEYGFGADVELLLAHKFSVRLRAMMAVDPRDRETESQMRMDFKRGF